MSPIFASAKSSRSDVFVSFGDRKCDIEKCGTVRNAGAEIVGLENKASDCPMGWKYRTGKCMNNMRGWKMRDWKMRHQLQGVKMRYNRVRKARLRRRMPKLMLEGKNDIGLLCYRLPQTRSGRILGLALLNICVVVAIIDHIWYTSYQFYQE